ncbi:response regulator [Phenylobacterium sp.]|uniref:response regulator n=1 Tax=Phenylobacterium sp. TaxID=1871053 RepID=UPI0035B07ECF
MSAAILTVDDSASIRVAIRIALSGAGYTVAEASNGKEGVDKANAGAFDLIVSDLNMPVMNGLEMVEALRRIPAHAGVPIIMLTTESDVDVKARAKAAGATGWITKPFDPEQLVRIVKKVLGR